MTSYQTKKKNRSITHNNTGICLETLFPKREKLQDQL